LATGFEKRSQFLVGGPLDGIAPEFPVADLSLIESPRVCTLQVPCSDLPNSLWPGEGKTIKRSSLRDSHAGAQMAAMENWF